MICPNCERECDGIVYHDGDCELCDGELDIAHCGCYYDDEKKIITQQIMSENMKRESQDG